jgi:stage II sporulation protein AA (anti-sigma F factor antagonist)
VATYPFGVEVGDRVVRLEGDIDLAVATQIVELIDRLTDCSQVDSLVIDLGAVTFVDSAGLNAIAQCRRRLEDQDSALVLANVPLTLQKLMQSAGTTRTFGLAV